MTVVDIFWGIIIAIALFVVLMVALVLAGAVVRLMWAAVQRGWQTMDDVLWKFF